MAMTAATSTRDTFDRPATVAVIDDDVSITTSVPSRGGMLATVWSSVRPRALCQLSDGACLKADPGRVWVLRCGLSPRSAHTRAGAY
jgi:hypothetical protein